MQQPNVISQLTSNTLQAYVQSGREGERERGRDSLVPRPKPPCGKEGLLTFERFLSYAHHYVIVFQMILHNPYGMHARV